MKSQDDNFYIKKCLEEDKNAFRYLVEKYNKMIYSYSLSVLRSSEDASDVTQEVFIKAFCNLNKYNKKYSFATWIYKIASNTIIDKLRIKQPSIQLNKNNYIINKTPLSLLIQDETLKKIDKAVNKLPPKQKVVFTLKVLYGFSTKEINEKTGMSKTNIKSNLYYAKQFIKKQLKDKDDAK